MHLGSLDTGEGVQLALATSLGHLFSKDVEPANLDVFCHLAIPVVPIGFPDPPSNALLVVLR